ncbi:MAG TPA: CopD family protein, partial [Ktedonobacterales bacterium]|nr:CopD family protein [Ktedonobacterales bacterium]
MPLSENPAPNANLVSPPARVSILFSERLNAAASRILVVDNVNHEVDRRDSHVLGDGVTMVVSLETLPPGTYVVFWRSTSADDGHIASMSYIFHVERADATVPPLTGPLPSNDLPGGNGASLDAPALIATLAQAISLLALTLILGGIFWRWIVMPRQPGYAPTLSQPLAQRFDRAWRMALWAMLGAIVVQVLAQVVELGGSLASIFTFDLYSDILFQSQFGFFTILQLVLAVDGIIWLYSQEFRRSNSRSRYIEIAFGVVLAITFVFGGHGAATTLAWAPFVDLVHVVAEGIWVGGLLTLALVILPDLMEQDPTCSATSHYVAKSVPAFSLPALASVGLLAATGPLNASVRMTSFSQLWTTGYGIVLLIKIALFVAMALISYDHAFRLRPRLAKQLAALSIEQAKPPSKNSVRARQEAARRRVQDLALGIASRLRVEAGVGAGVVVCAAFLAALSGTL